MSPLVLLSANNASCIKEATLHALQLIIIKCVSLSLLIRKPLTTRHFLYRSIYPNSAKTGDFPFILLVAPCGNGAEHQTITTTTTIAVAWNGSRLSNNWLYEMEHLFKYLLISSIRSYPRTHTQLIEDKGNYVFPCNPISTYTLTLALTYSTYNVWRDCTHRQITIHHSSFYFWLRKLGEWLVLSLKKIPATSTICWRWKLSYRTLPVKKERERWCRLNAFPKIHEYK